jgi:DNA-binding transcriptional LysR family regulator
MDLVGMEIFARVVEEGSFSAAARRLSLSKSVVSKHIARLETSMGVHLLNRTTRAVTVTEIGREFYARCAEMLAIAEQADSAATQMQSEPRGRLKVAVPVSLGMLYVAPALPQFLESCPELSVDLTLTNTTNAQIEPGVDVGVVVASEMPPGVIARRIGIVERRLCAAPAYVGRHGTPASAHELASHSCVLFSASEAPRRWELQGVDGNCSIDVNGRLAFNNQGAIRQAVLQGGGIALLPMYLIATDIARGDLVTVLPQYRPVDASISAVFPSNRHIAAKVRAFVDFLVDRLRRDFGSLASHTEHAALPPANVTAARAGD